MDVTQCYLSYLFTYGELRLPSLGILRLRKVPAKRMIHEKKIYGPDIIIDFEEDTSIQESHFVKILKNKYGFSKNEASDLLKQNNTRILNELINVRESSIARLGNLYQDETGHFKFSMDNDLQKALQSGFPDIPIRFTRSIVSDVPRKNKPETSALSIGFEPQEKIGWFFPLLALLATSLLLACLISCFFQKRFEFKSNYPVKKTEITVLPDIPANLAEKIPGDDQAMINIPLAEQEIPKDSFTPDDPEYYEDRPLQVGNSGEFAAPVTPNFGITPDQSLDEMLQLSAQKRKLLNEPCMVVVGSFQRRDLLDKMILRLNELNQNIYIEKYGSFYRTAILFDCQNKDPQVFLREIRKTLEKDAWLLTY